MHGARRVKDAYVCVHMLRTSIAYGFSTEHASTTTTVLGEVPTRGILVVHASVGFSVVCQLLRGPSIESFRMERHAERDMKPAS
jgi:hypothetical protein